MVVHITSLTIEMHPRMPTNFGSNVVNRSQI